MPKRKMLDHMYERKTTYADGTTGKSYYMQPPKLPGVPRPKAIPLGKDFAAAKQLHHKLMTAHHSGTAPAEYLAEQRRRTAPNAQTLVDWCDYCVTDPATGKNRKDERGIAQAKANGDRTLEDSHRQMLNNRRAQLVGIKRTIAAMAPGRIIANLTEAEVEDYYATRRTLYTQYNEPPAWNTINNELVLLRSCLQQAIDAALIKGPLPTWKILADTSRKRIPTDEEYHRLLACSTRPQQRPRTWGPDGYGIEIGPYRNRVLTFLYESGCRIGETLKIEWEDINWRDNLVTLRHAKKKKRDPSSAVRSIYVSDPALAVLREARNDVALFRKTRDAPLLKQPLPRPFPHSRDGYERHLRDTWLPLAKINDLHCHDFRRWWCTRKIDEGWDDKTITMITGHRDLEVFREHYVQIAETRIKRMLNGPERPSDHITIPGQSTTAPPPINH
jgi:integrase